MRTPNFWHLRDSLLGVLKNLCFLGSFDPNAPAPAPGATGVHAQRQILVTPMHQHRLQMPPESLSAQRPDRGTRIIQTPLHSHSKGAHQHAAAMTYKQPSALGGDSHIPPRGGKQMSAPQILKPHSNQNCILEGTRGILECYRNMLGRGPLGKHGNSFNQASPT